MDAGPGRAQPPANISRNGASAGGICAAYGLHACGVSAGDGASPLRIMGISDHRIFCADIALWDSARFYVSGGLPASARHWRDSRLGSVSLPFCRARARVLRRHAFVRACRLTQRISSRLEEANFYLRVEAGVYLVVLECAVLVRQISTRV